MWGVDAGKVSHMLILPPISLVLVFFDKLIPLFFGLPGLLSGEGAFQQFSLLEIQCIIFCLVGDVHKKKGISYEGLLDEGVQRGISGEAGSIVDLQNDGLEPAVEDNIEP